jgi:hypothetical protein
MENQQNHPLLSTNWAVRFLCDCRKQNKQINIHKGIAREISTHGVRILSDHQICPQKKIAMQVLIPSVLRGAPQEIIKIIGNSIVTVAKEGRFLTEIEFQNFEMNGLRELNRNLQLRFGPKSWRNRRNVSRSTV